MNVIVRLTSRLRAALLPDFDLSEMCFTPEELTPTDDYRPSWPRCADAVVSARTIRRPATIVEARPTAAPEPVRTPTFVPGLALSD